MEHNEAIDLTRRKMTSRLIVERALARGWDVTGFDTLSSLFVFDIPGHDHPVKILGGSPPQTSFASTKTAKDKVITNALLQRAGLPVPAEIVVSLKSYDISRLSDFLAKYGKAVVKPLDGAHGKGITVDIINVEQLKQAIAIAASATKMGKVLLQQQVAGVDVRVVCIDYKYADAMSRQPATVIGDGKHSIRQLIEITNNSSDRGKNYTAKLNFIDMNSVELYLGAHAMERIPNIAEPVQVVGISNIGAGGERRNITYDIPPFIKDMALVAARTLQLPVCGIDFMVRRIPQSTDSLADLDPYIIEANATPMLAMYDNPYEPEQTALIDAYLDLVSRG